METAGNKALTIATAVFITIMITSGVFFSVGQMQNIYSQVYETDISIQNRFGEYEAFDNTEKTGIDLLNTAKKYRDSEIVTVRISAGEKLNTSHAIERLPSILGSNPGEELYKVSVNKDKNDRVEIVFIKK